MELTYVRIPILHFINSRFNIFRHWWSRCHICAPLLSSEHVQPPIITIKFCLFACRMKSCCLLLLSILLQTCVIHRVGKYEQRSHNIVLIPLSIILSPLSSHCVYTSRFVSHWRVHNYCWQTIVRSYPAKHCLHYLLPPQRSVRTAPLLEPVAITLPSRILISISIKVLSSIVVCFIFCNFPISPTHSVL